MELNKSLTNIETTFNKVGSLPVIGMASGTLRLLVARIVQATVGAILVAAGLIGQVIGNDTNRWKDLTKSGLEQMLHAELNSVRAAVEIVSAFTIVGSFVMFGCQYFSENKFAPIIKYDEAVSANVFKTRDIDLIEGQQIA